MSLVSIIMPCFNSERFLNDSIQSVLSQSYEAWELIVINDGSVDRSKEIILSFDDRRIRYFEQVNQGVSAARNIGLMNMKGDFFCFLDADDLLPVDSLKARVLKFETDKRLSFVDGFVTFFDDQKGSILRRYSPAFTGPPLKHLLLLNGKCFACPSWMIKRDHSKNYAMRVGLTHGEDLLFYMELARSGQWYDSVRQDVLSYRRHPHSAMQDTEGLENSYWQIFSIIRYWPEFPFYYRLIYKFRVKKFMMLEYLRRREIRNGFSTLLK